MFSQSMLTFSAPLTGLRVLAARGESNAARGESTASGVLASASARGEAVGLLGVERRVWVSPACRGGGGDAEPAMAKGDGQECCDCGGQRDMGKWGCLHTLTMTRTRGVALTHMTMTRTSGAALTH